MPRGAGRRNRRPRRESRTATRAASSLNPYRRMPHAMNELSNGHTVPDVVADRVPAHFALGEGSDAPPRIQARAHEVPDNRFRLRLVDDPAPQQVPVVRSERIDLVAFGIDREREVLAVLDPEVAVEAPLQRGRFLLQLVGEVRVVPDRRAPCAHRASWRRTRNPGARTSRVESRAGGRRGRRSSPRSPSSIDSRDRSPRCGAGTTRSRCPGGRRTRRASSARRAPRARAPRTSLVSPLQRSYSSSSTTNSGVASAQP